MSMPIGRSRLSFLGASTLFVSAATIAAGGGGGSGGSFCGLGDLPGGIYYSEANAVSTDGTVVVGASRSTGGTEAFLWTATGGLRGLRDLPGGSVYSRAFDVSANGRVVVGESSSSNGDEAFAWVVGPGMVGLGDLDGGEFSSTARGVSRNGRTIAGSGRGEDFAAEGFVWTPVGGLARLTIDEDVFTSEAFDVSDDGSVVVGKAYVDSAVRAFRWTPSDGLRGIGDLPGGNVSGVARAVSADGSVIVGTSESDLGSEAFRWTAGAGMRGLGGLPGGQFGSDAVAVSGDGAVVVGSSFSTNGSRAFIWDGVDGLRDLASELTNRYGIDLSGWTLTEATGVSADGTVIVGNGTNPAGQFEGWIATLDCASGVLAGRANTGDGSPPFPVFTIDGSFGGSCREVDVAAGVPVNLEISNPPSVTGAGHYALWIYDGAPQAGVSAGIRLRTVQGESFEFGLGPRCLPVNNSVSAGECPCPLTFPVGWTSKPLNAGKAAQFCLNPAPAFPRSPTILSITFPAGDFTLGGLVLDMNSIHSPRKNASIGNWIAIRSR